MLTLAGRLLVARQTLLPEIFVLSELQGTQFRSAKGLRYLELSGVKGLPDRLESEEVYEERDRVEDQFPWDKNRLSGSCYR
jgi:hypothetical protein